MAKGKGGNTVAVVERIARPVVEALGYRLWDVRYEKEGPDHFLRVFIDKDGDMDTADCEKVSRALDPLIDEADPIEESYYFEVGSPGLGRRLTRPEHFAAVLRREGAGKALPRRRLRAKRIHRRPHGRGGGADRPGHWGGGAPLRPLRRRTGKALRR